MRWGPPRAAGASARKVDPYSKVSEKRVCEILISLLFSYLGTAGAARRSRESMRAARRLLHRPRAQFSAAARPHAPYAEEEGGNRFKRSADASRSV